MTTNINSQLSWPCALYTRLAVCIATVLVLYLNVIELHFRVHCRDLNRKRPDLCGTSRFLVQLTQRHFHDVLRHILKILNISDSTDIPHITTSLRLPPYCNE